MPTPASAGSDVAGTGLAVLSTGGGWAASAGVAFSAAVLVLTPVKFNVDCRNLFLAGGFMSKFAGQMR